MECNSSVIQENGESHIWRFGELQAGNAKMRGVFSKLSLS